MSQKWGDRIVGWYDRQSDIAQGFLKFAAAAVIFVVVIGMIKVFG